MQASRSMTTIIALAGAVSPRDVSSTTGGTLPPRPGPKAIFATPVVKWRRTCDTRFMSVIQAFDTSAGTEFLLPDPEPRQQRYTIISVDDHLVEPPDLFEGRLPARLQPDAPRIVVTPEGHEVWE